MSDVAAAERTWTDVGADIDRAQVEAAIDALEWRDVIGAWPFSHGAAIKYAIQELRIPRVKRAAVSTLTIRAIDGEYALYAIEGHYTNGRAVVYIADRGVELTPVASDFEPGDQAD